MKWFLHLIGPTLSQKAVVESLLGALQHHQPDVNCSRNSIDEFTAALSAQTAHCITEQCASNGQGAFPSAAVPTIVHFVGNAISTIVGPDKCSALAATDRLLREGQGDMSKPVAIAIDAYTPRPGDAMRKPIPLAPRLAQSCPQFGYPDLARGPIRDSSFLQPSFRARRHLTAHHVEVRTVDETASILRELCASESFRSKANCVSLCINVTMFAAPDDLTASEDNNEPTRYIAPVALSSVNLWYINEQHIASWLGSAEESMRLTAEGKAPRSLVGNGGSFSPFALPAYPIVACGIFITKAQECSELRPRLKQLVDYEAKRLPKLQLSLLQPDDDGAAYSPNTRNRIRRLEAEKIRLIQSLADTDAALNSVTQELVGAERLTLEQQGLDDLMAEHDWLEGKFTKVSHLVASERKILPELESAVESARIAAHNDAAALRTLQEEAIAAHAASTEAANSRSRLEEDLLKAQDMLQKAYVAKGDSMREVEDQRTTLAKEHKEELQRLSESRAVAVESANAELGAAEKEIREAVEQNTKAVQDELLFQKKNLSQLQKTSDSLAVQVVELSASLATLKEAAATFHREKALLVTERDEVEKGAPLKKGECLDADLILHLEAEEAGLQAELAKVTEHSATLRAKLVEARNVCQRAVKDKTEAEANLERYTDTTKHEIEAAILAQKQAFFDREAKKRRGVEIQQNIAITRIAQNEAQNWAEAVDKTEIEFHNLSHGELRREILSVQTRRRVGTDRADELEKKGVAAKEHLENMAAAHREIVAEYQSQYDEILRQEQSITETEWSKRKTQELHDLESKIESVTDTVAKLRQALAQATTHIVKKGAAERTASNPSAAIVVTRLRKLLRATENQTAEAERCRLADEATNHRLERELTERNDILSRLATNVRKYHQKMDELQLASERKNDEIRLDEAREDRLLEQLKDEYVHAQEVTARHRRDNESKIRESTIAIDQMTESIQASTKEVSRLERHRDELRRMNTPAHEATLRLELQQEGNRFEELERLFSSLTKNLAIQASNLGDDERDSSAQPVTDTSIRLENATPVARPGSVPALPPPPEVALTPLSPLGQPPASLHSSRCSTPVVAPRHNPLLM